MPALVVIRLLPSEPIPSKDFSAYLDGLSITAHDASFQKPTGTSELLGKASYLPPTLPETPSLDPAPVPDPDTGITQHFTIKPALNLFSREMHSVATAVIEVPDAALTPEHDTIDVRLTIDRAGTPIARDRIHYNVQVAAGSLPGNPNNFPKISSGGEAVVSLHVFLPAPGQEAADTGLLPEDGTPPNFDTLQKDIEKVLNNDPGHLNDIAELTPAQAKHIAREIVWPRMLPEPDMSLEAIYTGPHESDSDEERSRQLFEGELIAVHAKGDGLADRLAGIVYAVSVALWCEEQSVKTAEAGLRFPVRLDTPEPTAKIKLINIDTTAPFKVPAAYWYALTATLPIQVNRTQRYSMTVAGSEAQALAVFDEALHNNIFSEPSDVNRSQAARRLAALALGLEPKLTIHEVVPGGEVQELVTAWLEFASEDISTFWTSLSPSEESGHLRLLLAVVTQEHEPLVTALGGPPLNVSTVDTLEGVTDTQWLELFSASPTLLPPFSAPGTIPERTAAFLRHLRKYLNAAPASVAPPSSSSSELPLLPRSPDNLVDQLASLVPGLDLETFDPAANAAALDAMFPNDPQGRDTFIQWIECIQQVLALAKGIEPDPIRFSVVEALWARGFVRAADLDGFSLEAFTEALAGTVAYDHAATIFANADALGASPLEPVGKFTPVNPNGALTQCIPPKHLSPLGPVGYLVDLLGAHTHMTCDGLEAGPNAVTVKDAVGSRRGSIGDLKASYPNSCVPIPLIDIVNESLERLVLEGVPAIYNTARDELGGHVLDTALTPAEGAVTHDAVTMFEALPEHSTPAIPTASQGAWDALMTDFSSCELPYHQPLDVLRTYLEQLGTDQFDTMRAVRREITEFVLAPDDEPTDFQTHLWRYPVRMPLALAYLSITPQEYKVLYQPGQLNPDTLPSHFGFVVNNDDNSWLSEILQLPVFMARTCLSYCEVLELSAAGFVAFELHGPNERPAPVCEPCCLEELKIVFIDPPDTVAGLKLLSVFIRLWRSLRAVDNAAYSFTELADIARVLVLFKGTTVNADFIRQLAAFQMLRDEFGLDLSDGSNPSPEASGADRTHLLAFWEDGASKFGWAVQHLLNQVQQYTICKYNCDCRPPEFLKLLAANLDPLSRLAGFDPDDSERTWHALPTHTLRMAEILAKIYASRFGVGEILWICTAAPQLRGGDPFPAQTDNEARDLPFDLPDNEYDNSLFALRDALRAVEVDETAASEWTWTRIGQVLHDAFGLPMQPDDDRWDRFGKHFFPTILQAEGYPVASSEQLYEAPLPVTSAPMWNTPPGPFRYRPADGVLEALLPLSDAAVLDKLARVRQLDGSERLAVETVYIAPRAELAFFSFLFENQRQAEHALIEQPDEAERWAWFQRAFATFYTRCQRIAAHVAGHINRLSPTSKGDGVQTAMLLMKHLWADENTAESPWEHDTGSVPDVTWHPRPNGGAFHALLGVVGTGMLAEYRTTTGQVRWREIRGGVEGFGEAENAANAPLPTIIPHINTSLALEQLEYVAIRNGFAMSNEDGRPLGGAEPFVLTWRGLLLIEQTGEYGFSAGAPTPHGKAPDFEVLRRFHRWRVTLQQGQRTWILLAHNWPDEEAPASCATPVNLERGFYDLTIEFERLPLMLDGPEDVCPQTTGFALKYTGPDAGEGWTTIPHNKLFIATGTALDDGIRLPAGSGGIEALATRHVVSVRSMRRTMQRLVKAMRFAAGFNLGALAVADSGESELGFMLAHPENFAGQSYYDTGGNFKSHRAHFDFNLLPIGDNYESPAPSKDKRADPSPQRMSALFDWWERMFDYTVMRTATQRSPERPVWLLFHEAAESHEDIPGQLLRHMGVDIRHQDLVTRYFDSTQAPLFYSVTSDDLVDDRWAIRIWRADRWVRTMRQKFLARDIREAQPYLWASDGPEIDGLDNLTKFYRDGCISNGKPRRYREVKRLNDGLRERGRAALLAYLTRMERVALPWGGFVTAAHELSELLLVDVEVGLCQKAARVEEATTAVQLFVSRARLGLESDFVPGPGFAAAYDRRLATFSGWQACKRRSIYRESWISWDADAVSSGSEAYQFLTSELRRADLTLPEPGGLTHGFDPNLPPHEGLKLLQAREPSTMTRLDPTRDGLGLLGTPDRHARTTWLAPLGRETAEPTPIPGAPDVIPRSDANESFPMWLEAAVRLGTNFVRVAAAATPAATTDYTPQCGVAHTTECCAQCGAVHPAHMDEYYFWVDVSEEYRPVEQIAEWISSQHLADADAGVAIPETAWHDPEALPGLLHWKPRKIARLNWCRVHNGEFQTPRRSAHGVEVNVAANQIPDLTFTGRVGDSLSFDIEGGVTPAGHPAAPPPGFRYDIAPDDAVRLPEVVPAESPKPLGGLAAFPFFAWHTPGAPLVPPERFGTVLAVATHLANHCRYEQALKWLELRWAPLTGNNVWADCDSDFVKPHDSTYERPVRPRDPVGETGDSDSVKPHDSTYEVPVRPRDPVGETGKCCCPSGPVSDEVAIRRHIVMLYIEILLDWSDALMRRNTPEAFARARLLADTARRILGPTPKTIAVKPESDEPPSIVQAQLDCAPLNPQLMCLYTRMQDRLDAIHNCMNAPRQRNGKPNIDMPYFGDSTVRACWKVEANRCRDDWCTLTSPYRFVVLVDRAQRAAAECRAMGGQLLAAFEKGDVEYLSQLRVLHERQLSDLTLSVRQDQWREADWQVQALQKAKAMATTNLNYYQVLINAGLLAGEAQYEPLTGTATGLRAAGNVLEAIGQSMNLIPDPNVGFPTNFITLPPGKKLAMIFASMGTVVNVAADIVNTVASLGLTKDGWARREAEWKHQVDLFTIEIEQIERQILAAERRRDSALQELNTHRQAMANTAEVHDFIRDKFTNHALYLWLQKQTAALHATCYELALQCAIQAEQAYNFERGLTAERFIPGDAWDSLHEGLLSGERLGVALSRMQKAYEDRYRREYELTKHISLRHHFPGALAQLVATGQCEVELPEWLFDLDYPGHYMRRIKSLSFSLPCVVGPFAGVHCRVTLLSSKLRTSPHLLEPDRRCCDARGCNNGYPALPNDSRVKSLYAATEAVATSSGNNDTGLFELDLRDPRYLPFEYHGAVCRLRIELPHDNNYFDVDTLTDFVVHMRYMAREGGEMLRAAARECTRNYLPGNGVKFIDAKRELRSNWRTKPAPRRCGSPDRDATAQMLGLELKRKMFPFLTAGREHRVVRLQVLFEAPDAEPSTHHSVTFYAGQNLATLDPDTCREGVFTIECVGDAAWPGFYHGVLELDPVALRGDETTDVGVLCFGPSIKRLCDVWLLLGYEAVPGPGVCSDLNPHNSCRTRLPGASDV